MSVPSSILPPLRQQRDRGLDRQRRGRSRLNASRAPKTAALTSRMSCAVSMMIRSAPPSTRPLRLLGEDLDQLAEGDRRRASGRRRRAGSRSGRSSRRRSGPRRPPCGRSRRPCVLISSVCSPRPHSSSFSRRALEGVGLDHLGAGLEHRRVDALDHVGAVEHERLVALALRARRSPPGSGRTARGSRPCRRRRRRRARGRRRGSPGRHRIWLKHCAHLHRSRLSHRALLRGARSVAAASQVRVPRPLWMADDRIAARMRRGAEFSRRSRSPRAGAGEPAPLRAPAGACPTR